MGVQQTTLPRANRGPGASGETRLRCRQFQQRVWNSLVRREQRDWYPLREVAGGRGCLRRRRTACGDTACTYGQEEVCLKVLLISVLLLVLVGCAHPPQLTTSVEIQKKSDDLILVILKVTNTEDRATTPIALELTGQSRSNGHWDRPATLLHPAAFVLNRKEQREITKIWRIQADAVRTTLAMKEQENGHLLKTEKVEKVF